MERDLEYENSNIVYDGIKCKNYILCGNALPEWWFDAKNNYLCTNCHMQFGTWNNAFQFYVTLTGNTV